VTPSASFRLERRTASRAGFPVKLDPNIPKGAGPDPLRCDLRRSGQSPRDLDPAVDFRNHGSFEACPREVLAHRAELRGEMEAATRVRGRPPGLFTTACSDPIHRV